MCGGVRLADANSTVSESAAVRCRLTRQEVQQEEVSCLLASYICSDGYKHEDGVQSET